MEIFIGERPVPVMRGVGNRGKALLLATIARSARIPRVSFLSLNNPPILIHLFLSRFSIEIFPFYKKVLRDNEPTI